MVAVHSLVFPRIPVVLISIRISEKPELLFRDTRGREALLNHNTHKRGVFNFVLVASCMWVRYPEFVVRAAENAVKRNATEEINMFEKGCKIKEGKLLKVRSHEETFKVPEGVEEIDSHAFNGCSELKAVEIPESVQIISWKAFSGSPNLSTIRLPDGLECIESDAFEETAYYKDPSNWTDGVLYIGNHLIAAKKDVRVCTVREGTRCIADKAFADCKELTQVVLADSVTVIGQDAFAGCEALASITFPEKMTRIGQKAFINCGSLTEVVLPDGLERIERQTFDGCAGLLKVMIPGSVLYIEEKAFAGCSSMTEISLPFDARVSAQAFVHCTNSLKTVRHTATRAGRIGRNGVRNSGNDAFLKADWIYED